VAISKSTPIDFAKIALEMRDIVARWYNATIQIVDPNVRDLNDYWNPATNTYSQGTETLVWSGSARIQPVSSASEPDLGITQGAIESIRVQVPYDNTLGLIRKGMQVVVTDGGENHVLESLQFVVLSAINSSYGWNTTIECDADIKAVADG